MNELWKKCRMALLYAAVIPVLMPVEGLADIHLVKEDAFIMNKGMTQRITETEIWQSAEKKYTRTGDRVIIIRKDLNKRWSIDLRSKTYTETALDTPPSARPYPQMPSDFHNEGYDYTPRYDWIMTDTGITEEIAGRLCRKVIFDGDADYSEKIVEVWVLEDPGPDMEKFNEFREQLQTMTTFEYLDTAPELKKAFIMKEKAVNDHHIILSLENDMTVSCLEDVEPPAGIYDVPEGFESAKSPENPGRRGQ